MKNKTRIFVPKRHLKMGECKGFHVPYKIHIKQALVYFLCKICVSVYLKIVQARPWCFKQALMVWFSTVFDTVTTMHDVGRVAQEKEKEVPTHPPTL